VAVGALGGAAITTDLGTRERERESVCVCVMWACGARSGRTARG
jgi:hypothetical protein